MKHKHSTYPVMFSGSVERRKLDHIPSSQMLTLLAHRIPMTTLPQENHPNCPLLPCAAHNPWHSDQQSVWLHIAEKQQDLQKVPLGRVRSLVSHGKDLHSHHLTEPKGPKRGSHGLTSTFLALQSFHFSSVGSCSPAMGWRSTPEIQPEMCLWKPHPPFFHTHPSSFKDVERRRKMFLFSLSCMCWMSLFKDSSVQKTPVCHDLTTTNMHAGSGQLLLQPVTSQTQNQSDFHTSTFRQFVLHVSTLHSLCAMGGSSCISAPDGCSRHKFELLHHCTFPVQSQESHLLLLCFYSPSAKGRCLPHSRRRQHLSASAWL